MGLDQYAGSREYRSPDFTWRKHPNLHGWMENLWNERGNEGQFNTVELRLSKEDIKRLRKDITEGTLTEEDTTGCFFGGNSDEYYKEQDLEFCEWALKEIDDGKEVFYDSWW